MIKIISEKYINVLLPKAQNYQFVNTKEVFMANKSLAINFLYPKKLYFSLG